MQMYFKQNVLKSVQHGYKWDNQTFSGSFSQEHDTWNMSKSLKYP